MTRTVKVVPYHSPEAQAALEKGTYATGFELNELEKTIDLPPEKDDKVEKRDRVLRRLFGGRRK